MLHRWWCESAYSSPEQLRATCVRGRTLNPLFNTFSLPSAPNYSLHPVEHQLCEYYSFPAAVHAVQNELCQTEGGPGRAMNASIQWDARAGQGDNHTELQRAQMKLTSSSPLYQLLPFSRPSGIRPG